jgi:hypothetical protein
MSRYNFNRPVNTHSTISIVPSIMTSPFPSASKKTKYTVSQTLVERVLLPAVRAASADTILVSNGFSCREQIQLNTPRKPVHLAEVLAGDINQT